MRDIKPITNIVTISFPYIIDLLNNDPDDLYRIFLNNGKMYQAIKSNGEVTTLVDSRGVVFRRAKKSLANYVAPEWVDVGYLEDINRFLLVAQVKGWI